MSIVWFAIYSEKQTDENEQQKKKNKRKSESKKMEFEWKLNETRKKTFRPKKEKYSKIQRKQKRTDA